MCCLSLGIVCRSSTICGGLQACHYVLLVTRYLLSCSSICGGLQACHYVLLVTRYLLSCSSICGGLQACHYVLLVTRYLLSCSSICGGLQACHYVLLVTRYLLSCSSICGGLQACHYVLLVTRDGPSLFNYLWWFAGLAPDQIQFSHKDRNHHKSSSFHKLVAEYKSQGMDVKQAAAAAVEWLQADAQRDFVVASGKAERSYVLRPEIAESLYVMHRVTGNETYKEWAWDLFSAIEKHCKVDGGYGAHRDVTDLEIGVEDSMESFFLAETLKYLWLIFSDETNMLTEYVFNTEAHPFAIRRENEK